MTLLSFIHENQHWAACNDSYDLHKERAPCRYYQMGRCRRGSSCPFVHVPAAAQVESYPSENIYAYYPLAQSPVYLPLSSPAQPVFLWQPYPPLSPSFDPRYGVVCQTEKLPDFPDDESDPSSVESPSTVTSIDRQFRLALDTASLEGLESGALRGVAGSPGDVGSNPSPRYPGYSYPVFPGAQTEGVTLGGDRATSGQCLDQSSMVALASPFVLPWQDDARKKPLAYKTKPCKFYAANGKCTSGDKCTFIHEREYQGNTERPPQMFALSTDAKLPPKPIDRYDECRARDFYPITWRVIGGGVMMGGKRPVCPAYAAGQCKYGNDCKLAHETELETDDVGFIEPKNEPVRKGAAPKRVPRASVPRKGGKEPPLAETSRPAVLPLATPRPRRPVLPPLDCVGATRRKDQVAVSSAPASPVHRRTQSMTMVASPPVDTTSYAAEL